MFWAIVMLLILGTLFLIAEIFVIGGVVGFIGLCIMGLSVYLCFEHYGMEAGTSVLLISLLITSTVFFVTFYLLPRTGLRKGFILEDSMSSAGGYTSDSYLGQDWVGKEGVTESELRPSGVAVIGAQRMDVVTEGEFIEPRVRIRVIRSDGNRVVVERV